MKVFFFSLALITSTCFGDYGWIPQPQTLILKTGWELFKSEANFDSTGTKRPLTTNSLSSNLTQNHFLFESEYGLTENWSAGIRSGFLSAQVEGTPSSFAPLSVSGFSDASLSLKWRFREQKPLLVLETALVIPPYSTINLGTNDLAVGDGVAGILLRLHGGARVKKVTFSLSPGFLFRMSRFSNQILLDAAVSINLRKFYFRLFESSFFSMTKDNLIALSPENTELGSGGSYSRLALQPDLLAVGLKAGMFFSPKFRLEAGFSQTVWGHAAADGFRLGLTLIRDLNLAPVDDRETVVEVPLNAE